MRLKEIYKIIKPNIVDLNINSQKRNDGTTIINNVVSITRVVKNIEETGLFENAILKLKSTKLYEGFTDALIVNDHHLGLINQGIDILRFSCEALIQSLRKANINLEDEEFQVSISLPENLSFEVLSKSFSKLKKGFEIPVADLPEGGEIRIKNFDSGSFWVDILLPTTSSFALIGSIIWSAAVIHNKRLQNKAMKAYVDGLNHQADWIEQLKTLGEKQIDSYIEEEARIVERENFSGTDNERLKRLSLSIKETSELISNGVKMYPSLAAPETAKNLFPNFGTLSFHESKMKRLGDSNSVD